jgi:hypothetical protein
MRGPPRQPRSPRLWPPARPWPMDRRGCPRWWQSSSGVLAGCERGHRPPALGFVAPHADHRSATVRRQPSRHERGNGNVRRKEWVKSEIAENFQKEGDCRLTEIYWSARAGCARLAIGAQDAFSARLMVSALDVVRCKGALAIRRSQSDSVRTVRGQKPRVQMNHDYAHLKQLVAALRPQPAPADLLRRLPTARNDSCGSARKCTLAQGRSALAASHVRKRERELAPPSLSVRSRACIQGGRLRSKQRLLEDVSGHCAPSGVRCTATREGDLLENACAMEPGAWSVVYGT